jgi:hypothetical protein
MVDTKHQLLVHWWWEQHRTELREGFPWLKEPESQEHPTASLEQEDTPCRESRQSEDEDEDGQKEAVSLAKKA